MNSNFLILGCRENNVYCLTPAPLPVADTVDFEIHVDRVFKWSAATIAEKEAFVRCLYRYSRCLPKSEQIHFKNGRSDLFEDIQGTSELAAKMNALGG